jgi:hypothetical protein
MLLLIAVLFVPAARDYRAIAALINNKLLYKTRRIRGPQTPHPRAGCHTIPLKNLQKYGQQIICDSVTDSLSPARILQAHLA